MPLKGDPLFDPGLLDRYVTIFTPTEGRDADGGVVLNWVSQGIVAAEFRPQPGREVQQAGQKVTLAQAKFRMRWRVLSPKARIKLYNTFYEVVAPVIEVGRYDYIDVICQAIDPANYP